jgi:hypothetical protein
MLTATVEKCKLCGCPVRIVRRADGSADHYEALEFDALQDTENKIPAPTAQFLRDKRRGKRTVAIVGSAWTTRSWAPYQEPGVEVWCFNEMHGQPGVGQADRWFQLHPRREFTKEHRFDHWGWLQKDHEFPIYMQMEYDGIPRAARFPLKEIQTAMLGKLWRGERPIEKLFGSSMSYAVAMALWEKRFDRIELFGIELALEGEWAYQRESMAFWLGKADGMGLETWMPEQCELFRMPLYAYEEIRKGDGSVFEAVPDAP